MLHLICGRAGSGKTNYLRNLVKNDVQNDGAPVLIVPEQYSFETERAVLSAVGARHMARVTVTGFSRLALSVLRENNLTGKPHADDGVRAVLMSETLSELSQELHLFSRMKDNAFGLSELVQLNNELKLCGVSTDDLRAASGELSGGILSDKLKELALIQDAFDALLEQSYFDEAQSLLYFNRFASLHAWFAGKTVYVDAFRAFSGQELACIELALGQAKDVYITLCTDRGPLPEDSVFLFMDEFRKMLIAAANRSNTPVAPPVYLPEENAFPGSIAALERGLYTENPPVASVPDDESVTILSAGTMESECYAVAAQIRRIVRTKGYRYREIGIIERTAGTYRDRMVHALRRLDIPVFDDSRRSLSTEPLFLLVSSALEAVAGGFRTEEVLKYLKTGLTPLSADEISLLENYCLVWDIDASAWMHDFTMHPDGYRPMDEKAVSRLEALNNLRKKAIVPLLRFRKKCEEKNGREIAAALYELLEELGAANRLFSNAEALETQGFASEASRSTGSWDELMQLLDSVALLTGERVYTFKRWTQLFSLLCANASVGEIPQGIDEVSIGSADRIRTEQLKVVFLVGVNHDEFPHVSAPCGILNDADRAVLNEHGVSVRPSFRMRALEERFITYCSVTAAKEKLYLSYRTVTANAQSVLPSELIDEVCRLVPQVKIRDLLTENPLSCVENADTAFRAYASVCRTPSVEKSTLEAFLLEDGTRFDAMQAMARAAGKQPFSFRDSRTAQALFGEKMHLSASRVESFYQCAFSYFCRYGLDAREQKKASLDPAQSGTVIHFVLEGILRQNRETPLAEIPAQTLKVQVEALLEKYLKENMGGTDNKSKRFLFLMERLSETVMTILFRLQHEFSGSDFQPHDFELPIGGEEIPPYTLPLSDGAAVSISGAVDRVDLMERDGITYLRVIDYKTGKKEFRLASLLDGLNIQMVLYLMALTKNTTAYYGEVVPAGVLYLPSRIGIDHYLSSRSPSPEEVEATVIHNGKLSGMVLDSPVVFAGMGLRDGPSFLPVGYKKDGSPKGNYYSMKHYRALCRKMDSLIVSMGEELRSGKIPALPVGKNDQPIPCAWCPYRAICGYEDGDAVRTLRTEKHEDILSELEGEENEA